MDALHIERRGTITIELPAAQAFYYFTPEGERGWAADWDPKSIFPADGSLRDETVFTTAAHGEETVWMLLRHAPEAGEMTYIRLTPGSRLGVVTVKIRDAAPGRSVTEMEYRMTALTEHGHHYLEQMTEQRFEQYMREWEAAIGKVVAEARG
ncbi:MAG: hypothetical protein U0527_09470 [Candidatus Eisenbacteria bacterium]